MAVAVEIKKVSNDVCNLCNTALCDEIRLGEKFRIKDLIVHYYCVLLSYLTPQQGDDDDGLRGFLYKDIRREIIRSRKVLCYYCRRKGASIKCFECEIDFHLPCGVVNNSLSIFKDKFPTFCASHRPQQVIPKYIMEEVTKMPPSCTICFESINLKMTYEFLWAPCCKKTWYHRHCAQKSALNQASLFKCAVCSNNKKFNLNMIKYGIYIPERDAAWENEPNAFQSLSERHYQCDCAQCGCPYGRRADREGSRWEIILCTSCGATGTHIACSKLNFWQTEWECNSCSKITLGRLDDQNSQIAVRDPDLDLPSPPTDKSNVLHTDVSIDNEEPEEKKRKTDLEENERIEISTNINNSSCKRSKEDTVRLLYLNSSFYEVVSFTEATIVLQKKGSAASKNEVNKSHVVTSPIMESPVEGLKKVIRQSEEDEETTSTCKFNEAAHGILRRLLQTK